MSKFRLEYCCVLAVTAFVGAANAEDDGPKFSVRAGPTAGQYSLTQKVGVFDVISGAPIVSAQTFKTDDDSFALGLQLAPSLRYGRVFAEVALDLMQFKVEGKSLKRTDIVPSIGYLIGDHGTIYAGYRRGMQGDSLFDDKLFSESGYVLGAGLGNLVMEPFLLSVSAAYNSSKVEKFKLDGGDLDYDGFSVKLGAALMEYPQHLLQLRFQQFKGDDSLAIDLNGDGTQDEAKMKLKETYLQLMYQYVFTF